MKLEKVNKNLISQIPKKVYDIIDESINNVSFLRRWQLLKTIREYNAGKYDWIIELVSSIFRSFDMFHGYEQMVGSTNFETTTQVSIEPIPFVSGLGMNLYVMGIDDAATKDLKTAQFGGELKIGDQLRIIDKNTGVEEEDIQTAAYRMTEFFNEKFSKFLDEADE